RPKVDAFTVDGVRANSRRFCPVPAASLWCMNTPGKSVTATVTSALTEGSELLTAVTTCRPTCVPGVNNPADVMDPVTALPPAVPSTSQVTPPFCGSFLTVAVNCCVCDVVSAERLGLTS